MTLTERHGISRWHLLHVMAEPNQLAGHIVCRHAGLDTDQAPRQICQPGHNPATTKLLTQDDRPLVIQANQMQRVLTYIDANDVSDSIRLLRHGDSSSCF